LYLLLPLNLAIWGYVGYRIYDAMHEESPDLSNQPVTAEIINLQTKKDSFLLFANYRDPFLDNLTEAKSHYQNYETGNKPKQTPSKNNTNAKNPNNLTNQNNWPEIKYLGSVTNTKASNKSVAMVSIAGVTYTLKNGEEVNGIKLLSFSSDQVEFKKGKEKKVIQK
jgi:hypothetical protein